MRSLVVVAALGGVADADVHPRLTWVVSEVGAGHVDHTSGMAVGGAWELGVATKRTAAGVEVGLAGVCAWSNS